MGEKQILAWLNESRTHDFSELETVDDSVGGVVNNAAIIEDNDEDKDNLSVDENDTGSENSWDDEKEDTALDPDYVGAVWQTDPPLQQTERHIAREEHGVQGTARSVKTVVDSWKLFFPDSVLQDITWHTNIALSKMRENYQMESNCRGTDVDELSAVFGLLYLGGLMKSSHQRVRDLWATDGLAPPLFRLVMSYSRFYHLLNAMRFDDWTTREERRAVDKLAPIRELFEGFVTKCKEYYQVGECVTVDEMLENFRGKCPFRQYIPRKFAKYGIKLYALVDSETYYTSHLEVYCGTQPAGPYTVDNSPAAVVNRLVEHIQGTGRNVTMNKWFASIPLVSQLAREKNLTVVATLGKTKTDRAAAQLLNTRGKPVTSSLFAFGDNCMLLSYVPSKLQNVILISSRHETDQIDETSGDARKPVVLAYYDKTKAGVEVVNRLKSDYTVARLCSRWPLRLLYTLLDIGLLNAQIILSLNTNEKFGRKDFQKSLALDLVRNQMVRRSTSVNLSLDLKHDIRKYVGLPLAMPPSSHDAQAKCGFCPKRKNRKTQYRCASCYVPVCGEHTSVRVSRCHPCVELHGETFFSHRGDETMSEQAGTMSGVKTEIDANRQENTLCKTQRLYETTYTTRNEDGQERVVRVIEQQPLDIPCDTEVKQEPIDEPLDSELDTLATQEAYEMEDIKIENDSGNCSNAEHSSTSDLSTVKRVIQGKTVIDNQSETYDVSNSVYTCTQCPKTFLKKKNLNEHLRSIHAGIRHPCEICSKTFSCRGGLRKHLHTHRGIRFPCHMCPKSFSQKVNLKTHLQTHEGVRYFCDKCPNSFKEKRYLRNHLVTHEFVRRYHCENCPKSFSTKSKVRSHQLTHKPIDEPSDSELNTLATQEAYEMEDIKIENDSGNCSNAEHSSTSDLSTVKRVIQGKTVIDNQSETYDVSDSVYTCTQCPKTFLKKSNLNTHLRSIHAGIRHPCEICSKTFSCKGGLRKHLHTHQGIRFPCHMCPKSFSQKVNLKTHLQTHEGVRYFCDKCPNSFKEKRYLRNHLVTHEFVRRYHCENCPKSFSTKGKVRSHQLTHKS